MHGLKNMLILKLTFCAPCVIFWLLLLFAIFPRMLDVRLLKQKEASEHNITIMVLLLVHMLCVERLTDINIVTVFHHITASV